MKDTRATPPQTAKPRAGSEAPSRASASVTGGAPKISLAKRTPTVGTAKGNRYGGISESELVRQVSNFLLGAVQYHAEIANLANMPDDEFLKKLKQRGAAGKTVPLSTVEAVTSLIGRVAALLTEELPIAPAQIENKKLLAKATAQANAYRVQLMEKKELLSSNEMTSQLNITRQALSKAVLANRIFAINFKNERYYPAFFADTSLVRRDVERVSQALGDRLPWDKWHFFTVPRTSLEKRTPLEALRNGQAKQVIRAAEAFATR